jgi:hypothetical protein
VVADHAVLQRYLHRQGPALAHAAATGALAEAPRLSLVAARRPEVLRDYGPFEEWPHAEGGHLGINPLFIDQGPDGRGNVRLRRFPSARYEEEHAESKDYLPEMVEMPVEIGAALAQGKRTPEMENFIAHCVVLGLPRRYR